MSVTLWQDAAGTVPATANNDPVRRIDDKSGNGNHAIAPSDAARPLLKISGGLEWLEFDGTDDSMVDTFTVAQPWDRISAIRQITWTINDQAFGGGAANFGVLGQLGTTPALALYDGAVAPSTSDLALDTNGVVTERHNNASSRIAINSGSYVVGTSGTSEPGGITIGAAQGGAFCTNMRFYGAVMIDRALSDNEITDVRAYLAARSGVTL